MNYERRPKPGYCAPLFLFDCSRNMSMCTRLKTFKWSWVSRFESLYPKTTHETQDNNVAFQYFFTALWHFFNKGTKAHFLLDSALLLFSRHAQINVISTEKNIKQLHTVIKQRYTCIIFLTKWLLINIEKIKQWINYLKHVKQFCLLLSRYHYYYCCCHLLLACVLSSSESEKTLSRHRSY